MSMLLGARFRKEISFVRPFTGHVHRDAVGGEREPLQRWTDETQLFSLRETHCRTP